MSMQKKMRLLQRLLNNVLYASRKLSLATQLQ